jgi:prepilin-type N-terminal cleavage/methylation domain-containing protein
MSAATSGPSIPRAWLGTAPRAGFTLIEVLIAMAIGATVVLGARVLMERLGDGALRIGEAARAADADANGERLLRALVGSVEVGPEAALAFGGDEREARLTSWCETPAGWQERCRVTLVVGTLDGTPALLAALSTGDTLVVRRAARFAALRYLESAAGGGRWFRYWDDGLLAPRAIGVLLDGDTLIVRIGDRG